MWLKLLLKAAPYIAGVLLLSAFAYWGAILPRLELADERAAHAATKAACEKMRQEWATELSNAILKAQRQEQQYQELVDNQRRTLDETRAEIRRRDSQLAAVRADARGLRQQLATFAAAVPVPEGSDASGAVSTLGSVAGQGVELLEEGRQLLRECATDHDERAAEVRALVTAWPKP